MILLVSAAMHIDPKPPHPETAAGNGWQLVGDDTDTADWHPQVAALLCYWRTRRPEGRLPSRHAVDPFSLRALLPCMWMLDIERPADAPQDLQFRYRLAGTRFVNLLGHEVTRMRYDAARPRAYAANRTRLITVARDGVPTWRRGPMPLEDGTMLQTENLMLPLAADGRTADIILGISVRFGSSGQALT